MTYNVFGGTLNMAQLNLYVQQKGRDRPPVSNRYFTWVDRIDVKIHLRCFILVTFITFCKFFFTFYTVFINKKR